MLTRNKICIYGGFSGLAILKNRGHITISALKESRVVSYLSTSLGTRVVSAAALSSLYDWYQPSLARVV